MKKIIILFTSFASLTTFSSDLDEKIKQLAIKHNLEALQPAKAAPMPVTRLGAMLFHENSLSGNKDINCTSCHHPMFGTTEPIPFSIGTGGVGMGNGRQQRDGGVTKRHSPHLINLAYEEIQHMFWDGRVFRDQQTGTLITPEPSLNGLNPQEKDIAQTFSNSLGVQTIFPIVNQLEMMGTGNDISEAFKKGGNLAAWEAIIKRLTTGSLGARYLEQFKKAFPQAKKFHIGHVGEALGAFLGRSFNVLDTPYDRYLKGDSTAMTESEKRGLIVFAEKGSCTECHNGPHLSNWEFNSVGTPQFNAIAYKAPYDEGRFEATGDPSDRFKFRTPPLRHLAVTAPYMHNGAFATIEEVIEHYQDPKKSLETYQLTNVDLTNYSSQFVVDRDEKRNQERIDKIPFENVRNGISLTKEEAEDLKNFLMTGLLDYRFQRQRLRQ